MELCLCSPYMAPWRKPVQHIHLFIYVSSLFRIILLYPICMGPRIVTRLRTGRPRNRGSISCRVKTIISFTQRPRWLWTLPSVLLDGCREHFFNFNFLFISFLRFFSVLPGKCQIAHTHAHSCLRQLFCVGRADFGSAGAQ